MFAPFKIHQFEHKKLLLSVLKYAIKKGGLPLKMKTAE